MCCIIIVLYSILDNSIFHNLLKYENRNLKHQQQP